MLVSPISLYIDLEPHKTAELEVVARASLEFAAGIREAAFLFDPSFEFRIELERGDEGSLWLKAFIRWVRGVGHAHPTMKAITIAAGTWFALQTAEFGYQEILKALLESKDPEIVKLAPDQVEEIAQRVAKVTSSPTAAAHFRGVYRELASDPAVRGVGVSQQHETPPTVIVPRAEFAERAIGVTPAPPPGAKRTRTERGDFVIVRAVLKEGGGRWRLRGPNGEFSATITDDQFNENILAGTAPVPLAAEIHLTADLETTEELVESSAWKPVSFKITRVYGMERQPRQTNLFPPGGPPP